LDYWFCTNFIIESLNGNLKFLEKCQFAVSCENKFSIQEPIKTLRETIW